MNARLQSFQQLLSAHLFSVIASVSVNDGTLAGRPDPGEVRYSSPLSGWYWSVEPVADNLKGSLRSVSLGDKAIDAPSTLNVPFDTSFQRSYTEPGPNGEQLSVVETEVVLDAENRVARFRVMGNLSEVEREIAGFRNTLYFYLGIFALGGTLINAAVILFGLRPLDRVRRSLADIREGKVSRLNENLPARDCAACPGDECADRKQSPHHGTIAHSGRQSCAFAENAIVRTGQRKPDHRRNRRTHHRRTERGNAGPGAALSAACARCGTARQRRVPRTGDADPCPAGAGDGETQSRNGCSIPEPHG